MIPLYIGTYATGSSAGIYQVDFDSATGNFVSEPRAVAKTDNPSWLAVHPNGRVLYAVNEHSQFEGRPTGSVSAFAIGAASTDLRLLNRQPSSGTDPCFLVVSPGSRHVLVANYSSGTVVVLPIAADGSLQPVTSKRSRTGSGPVAGRQESPHAHHIVFDPTHRCVVWTDLGTDRIVLDRFDADTGTLTESAAGGVSLPAGSGPRHVAWHPFASVLYVLNELSSTVTTLSFDASAGTFNIGSTISAREAGATAPNTAAEIVVSGDGRYLYTSNRGDDDLMVFSIDAATMQPVKRGRVTMFGRTPRHFAIDPSGRWMIAAFQDSNLMKVFRIEVSTGVPQSTPQSVTVPLPVHVLFGSGPALR